MILIYPADSDKMRYFLRNENPNLILWGITEINGLIDANKEEAEYIANSLFKLEIKKELNRRDNDWKKSREELLTSVKRHIKKEISRCYWVQVYHVVQGFLTGRLC